MNDDKKYYNPYDMTEPMAPVTTPALGDPMQPNIKRTELSEEQLKQVAQTVADNLELGQQLALELSKLDAEANKISSREFKKFHPLFKGAKISDTGLSMGEFTKLSNEYTSRFDLFKPIYVMSDSDPSKIETEIIPMLRPLDAISSHEDHSHSTFYSKGDDDIPAVAQAACRGVAASIYANQTFDLPNEKLEIAKSLITSIKQRHPGQELSISLDGKPLTSTSNEKDKAGSNELESSEVQALPSNIWDIGPDD